MAFATIQVLNYGSGTLDGTAPLSTSDFSRATRDTRCHGQNRIDNLNTWTQETEKLFPSYIQYYARILVLPDVDAAMFCALSLWQFFVTVLAVSAANPTRTKRDDPPGVISAPTGSTDTPAFNHSQFVTTQDGQFFVNGR